MHTVTLSQNQLYELSDAAHEVITRMLRDGLDETEIKFGSLAALFGAYKALLVTLLGSLDTLAMKQLEPQVLAAIAKPKKSKNRKPLWPRLQII